MNKSHKLAWAAGFIDGEGWITVGARGAYKGRKSHYLRLGVNHVAPEPLYFLQELFGGSIEKQTAHTVVGNRKRRHRWVVNTKKADAVLKLLLPYLQNKKDVALLGIKLQATMGTTRKVTDELHNKREAIRNEIKRLNALD